MEEWSNVIDCSLEKINNSAVIECPRGEEIYLSKYSDAAKAIVEGTYKSGFQHWTMIGEAQGRMYVCLNDQQKQHGLLTTRITYPEKPCPEGEENYIHKVAEIQHHFSDKVYDSAFHHWQLFGKAEGMPYVCRAISNTNAASIA